MFSIRTEWSIETSKHWTHYLYFWRSRFCYYSIVKWSCIKCKWCLHKKNHVFRSKFLIISLSSHCNLLTRSCTLPSLTSLRFRCSCLLSPPCCCCQSSPPPSSYSANPIATLICIFDGIFCFFFIASLISFVELVNKGWTNNSARNNDSLKEKNWWKIKINWKIYDIYSKW